MKIYVTKNACSDGIRVVDAEERFGGLMAYKIKGWSRIARVGDFKLTEAEAVADAEARRAKRVKSLENQVQLLKRREIKIKVV